MVSMGINHMQIHNQKIKQNISFIFLRQNKNLPRVLRQAEIQ